MAANQLVTVAMMMVSSTQEPRAANVHGETQTSDRYRLGKRDRFFDLPALEVPLWHGL